MAQAGAPAATWATARTRATNSGSVSSVIACGPSQRALRGSGWHSTMRPSAPHAAAACGADGLIVECHPDPRNARCDGPQAITLDTLPLFASRVRAVAQVATPA